MSDSEALGGSLKVSASVSLHVSLISHKELLYTLYVYAKQKLAFLSKNHWQGQRRPLPLPPPTRVETLHGPPPWQGALRRNTPEFRTQCAE